KEEGRLFGGDLRLEVFDPQPESSAARPTMTVPAGTLFGLALGLALGGRGPGRFWGGLLGAAVGATGGAMLRGEGRKLVRALPRYEGDGSPRREDRPRSR